MYFSLYRDDANQWRWTLYAPSNRKIADSGESYLNKADAQYGIDLVRLTGRDTRVIER